MAELHALFVPELSTKPRLLRFVRDRLKVGILDGVFSPSMEVNGNERGYFLAENSAAEPFAFATWWVPRERFAWVDLLWVEPTARRRGHALRLLKIVQGFYGDNYELGLGVLATNSAMHQLMRKTSFAVYATQYQTIDNPFDHVVA